MEETQFLRMNLLMKIIKIDDISVSQRKGKMRGKFNQILFQLKSTGYKVKYKRS